MSRDYDDYDDFDDFYDYDFGSMRRGAGKWVALFVLIVILIAALGAILVKVYDVVPAPDAGETTAVITTVTPTTDEAPVTTVPVTTEAPVTTAPETPPAS